MSEDHVLLLKMYFKIRKIFCQLGKSLMRQDGEIFWHGIVRIAQPRSNLSHGTAKRMRRPVQVRTEEGVRVLHGNLK